MEIKQEEDKVIITDKDTNIKVIVSKIENGITLSGSCPRSGDIVFIHELATIKVNPWYFGRSDNSVTVAEFK